MLYKITVIKEETLAPYDSAPYQYRPMCYVFTD
jgi:hypothetical protein